MTFADILYICVMVGGFAIYVFSMYFYTHKKTELEKQEPKHEEEKKEEMNNFSPPPMESLPHA